MTITRLAEYLSNLELTRSRNRITEILARLLREASREETPALCYLTLGRLGPLFESLEFQLAEKMVIRAMAQAYGVADTSVRKAYKAAGDLGEVAEKLKVKSEKLKVYSSKFRVKRLSVTDVYRRLREIAEESGEGSQQRKLNGLTDLLHKLDALSTKYVIRMVLGRLRLGFSQATILDALSFMEVGDKSLRPQIEQAFFVRADVGSIAKLIRAKGIASLKGISSQLGVPVMPALCQRLKTADTMIKKMGTVAVEPKYDGQRVQIHWAKRKGQSAKGKTDGEFLRAFTRNLEEVSYMFPELARIGNQIQAREVILDSEAVGFDTQTGKVLPFQQIITRKRKHAIEEAARKVPLKFVLFDILFLNGKSLLSLPLSKRVDILSERVRAHGVLKLSERIVTDRAGDIRDFHRRQIEAGLEGVVVKRWDDPYIPGRRGWSWVKFKEAEEKEASLADTLDCIVMGYYRGRGKRAQFGIGGFLVGVRRGEAILSVSRIGTGLTDEQWRQLRKRGDAVAVSEKPKEYEPLEKSLIPDVWTAPEIVVEVAADNITHSPLHAAGLALRFPRLVRFRDDKGPGEATSLEEIKRLYRLQG